MIDQYIYLCRFLYFDKTHSAVAGDGQSLVVTVPRDLYPSLRAGLQQRNHFVIKDKYQPIMFS